MAGSPGSVCGPDRPPLVFRTVSAHEYTTAVSDRLGDIQEILTRVQARVTTRSPAGLRRGFAQVLSGLATNRSLKELAAKDGDLLGAAYERLLPAAFRRPRGQFFTPAWAGDVMAGWVLKEPRSLVLDPGVGSGALLLQVAQHSRRADARLYGVDRDALALRMAQANLRLRGIRRATLRVSDFLLKDLGLQPDGVVCNPPYGRHQVLAPSVKDAIHSRLERSVGRRFDLRTGLPALFLIRSLEVAKEGARLAFITPSGWLDAAYGREVKSYVLDQSFVEAIVLLEDEHLFFDGVLTTSAITFIRKEAAPRGHRTTVLRLARTLPPVRQVLAAINGAGGLTTTRRRFDADWRVHSKGSPVRSGVPLGDVARVRRGVATGMNRFFVLSEARRRELKIHVAHFRACLASPRYFPSLEIDDETLDSLPENVRRWLLDCRNPAAEFAQTPLGNYLRLGVGTFRANESHLASDREPWYALETRSTCPIVFPCFNRAAPRFFRNRTDAVALNNWFIIEPHNGVDADALYELLSSKVVAARLMRRRRVYGRGLWKVEPKELAALDLGPEASNLREQVVSESTSGLGTWRRR